MNKVKFNTIYSFLIVVGVLSISIGYSSFHYAMELDNMSVAIRIDRNIRITNVYINSTTNDAISLYEEYDEHELAFNVNLPKSTSSVKYTVKVTNFGNVESGIFDIKGLPEELTYEVSNYNLKTKMCNASNSCISGSEKEFLLTIKYKPNSYNPDKLNYNIDLNVEFSPVYNLTFNPSGGSVNTTKKEIMYNDFYGTMPTPTKTGYAFDGWYKESSLTNKVSATTKYTYTSNSTVYAKFTNTPPTEPTMNVSFPSGTTLSSGETIKAIVTMSGSTDAEDGTVTYDVTCSSASNVKKINNTTWELTFNKTGIFTIIGMACDKAEAKTVTTDTYQIKGSSSGSSSAGQFAGTKFNSGWTDIVPGCYLSGFSFFLQVPSGHSNTTSDPDTITITIKYKDGTTQKIVNFTGNLKSTPHSYDSSSYSGYFTLNETQIGKTPVSIKLEAYSPHSDCVKNSTITYDLQYTYDSRF